MADNEKPKNADSSDPMTELLRQMGLCEDEIEGALDLAEKIEKTVVEKAKDDTIPANLNALSKDELINTIKSQKSQLQHFQNVVAPQFILLIKKYKDRVLALEGKLRDKSKKIDELSLKLEYLIK